MYFELHTDSYLGSDFGDAISVLEADNPLEAVCTFAMKYAPCKVTRIDPELPGDTFAIFAPDSTPERGVRIEVFEAW